MKYVKLLRIKHYIKNVLIFLPVVFSGNLLSISLLGRTIIGFISFSLVCSFIYIINDISDVERDRNHPTKCKRPIASGDISIKTAYSIAFICLLFSVSICTLFLGFPSLVCILSYLVLNILYSKKLKNVPIVDVTILVSGFFLRVLFGSLITGISISTWLFLTIIAISFYLGLGKRRNEMRLQNDGGMTRKVLKFYNYAFLDKNMYMCMALANVFYALWAADHSIHKIIWTVPLVIVISMTYSLIVEGDSEGDPVEVILHDKLLTSLLLIYGVTIIVIMYVIK